MTGTTTGSRLRLARAVEGMHLSARRLRHELDAVLAVRGSDNLFDAESRRMHQALVATSMLLVLQSDLPEVLDARVEASKRLLAEAIIVAAVLFAQMDGHGEEG